MKQLFTLSLLLTLGGAVAAQDIITIQDAGGTVVNGTTVVRYGGVDEVVIDVHLNSTLVSGPTRNVNIRRYELDVVPGTQNYFCWGACYGQQDAGALPVWQALPIHSLNMAPGQTLTNFSAYHRPEELTGISGYRYVWFDVSSPNDSVWVDIEFRITPVGIVEPAGSVRSMAVFPNPSAGSDVEFTLDLAGSAQNTALVVYNMLGERVHSVALRSAQVRSTLATAGLSAGLYFATVERNGTTLATRRFVITGR